jgi:hypothetical protein
MSSLTTKLDINIVEMRFPMTLKHKHYTNLTDTSPSPLLSLPDISPVDSRVSHPPL